MAKQPAVYIVTSRPGGPLYTGVTSELRARIWKHREGAIDGFTKAYNIQRLVYFELCSDMVSAIQREKRIKKWRREWKVRLIEAANPKWEDLWDKIQ